MEDKNYRIEVKSKGNWRIGLHDYTEEQANQAKRNLEEAANAFGKKIKVRIVDFREYTS